jgi:hypothetical protein
MVGMERELGRTVWLLDCWKHGGGGEGAVNVFEDVEGFSEAVYWSC